MNPVFQSATQFINPNGVPYAGGTLTMYIPGTDDPKDSYSDVAGDALNTNPIVLDAAGRAVIYGDGEYRCVLRDALGNLIFDAEASSMVSAAMQPVVIAPDLATARDAMGVTAAIQTETDRAEAAEGALTTRLNTLRATVIDHGYTTTSSSGTATVTFAATFTTNPDIVVTAVGATHADVMFVVSPSTTTFSVYAADHTGTAVAIEFCWIAIQ